MKKLYSEEDIKDVQERLNSLKALARPPSLWNSMASMAGLFSTSNPSDERTRASYEKQYQHERDNLQEQIQTNTKKGSDEFQSSNHVVVGSVLTFICRVKKHLGQHLNQTTKGMMDSFEANVQQSLKQKLDLLIALMGKQDAKNANQALRISPKQLQSRSVQVKHTP